MRAADVEVDAEQLRIAVLVILDDGEFPIGRHHVL